MKFRIGLIFLIWMNTSKPEVAILDDQPDDVGPQIGCFEQFRFVLRLRKSKEEGEIKLLYARRLGEESDIWFSLSSSNKDLKAFRKLFEHQAEYDHCVTWYLQRGNTDQVRLTE